MKKKENSPKSDHRRIFRVQKELQVLIGNYLISGLSEKLPGLVTISRIAVPGDLRSGDVYVSVLGSDEDKGKALKILEKRAYEIQKYVGDNLKTRYCPKLTFRLDKSLENVLKVDRILYDLENEKAQQKKEPLNLNDDQE